MEKFKAIKELVADMEVDDDKFTKNRNGAAATRLRGKAQILKKLAQELRVEVLETKNSSK